MSNNTLVPLLSNSSQSPMAGVSETELWVMQVVFLGFIGGVISPAANAAMAIGIVKDKNLRSRFFVMLCYLLVARSVLGLQSLINFVHRTLRALNVVSVNMNRGYCYLIQMNVYYSLTLEIVLLLGMVLDRILAVVAYKYYHSLTHKQASVACAIAVVITITLKLIPSMIGIDFGETIPCINGNSPTTAIFNIYSHNMDLFIVISILILYVFLILYVRFRFLPMMKAMTQNAGLQSGHHVQFDAQQHLLPLLTRMVFLHCGIALIVRCMIASQILLPSPIALRLATYIIMPLSLDHMINIVFLLHRNAELRRATFPCCYTVVSPVALNKKPSHVGQPVTDRCQVDAV